jgi:DNA-binding HxlR family transcriptional regulator
MRDRVVPQLCLRFHRASELIGRRWTGAIIYVLLRARCRFATLREAVPAITDRMLSDRLQELEQEGIVVRTVVPHTPVRVEYELTKKGRALGSAVDAIARWAESWIDLDQLQPRGTPPHPAHRGAAPRTAARGRHGPARRARPGPRPSSS